MKKGQNEAEEKLLSQVSLDELIKMKMEEEMNAEIDRIQKMPEKQTVTEISKVAAEHIFSKNAVFKMFNRNTRTETYLNGVQAEAMLGLQTATREKLLSGQIDAFSTQDAYIKFCKIEI